MPLITPPETTPDLGKPGPNAVDGVAPSVLVGLEEQALDALLASAWGRRVLSSVWAKVAIGLVSTVAGLAWLLPFLRGSSSWEAKDAVVVIGLAGTAMGMLTSSGLTSVTRTAFLRSVASGATKKDG